MKASYPTPLTTSNALELVVKQPSEAEPIENRDPEIFGDYPNILSGGRGFDDQFDISQYGFHDLTGAMFISRTGPRKYDRAMYESNTSGSLAWTFDASRNSAVYGASGTNQPASIRFLCLIRSY